MSQRGVGLCNFFCALWVQGGRSTQFFFLWSHAIFLFRIWNKCKRSSPKIAKWDFSYFLDHDSKVYNSTVSHVPVIFLFFHQTQCSGLCSLISERAPRSLCDSTIKALVTYITTTRLGFRNIGMMAPSSAYILKIIEAWKWHFGGKFVWHFMQNYIRGNLWNMNYLQSDLWSLLRNFHYELQFESQ